MLANSEKHNLNMHPLNECVDVLLNCSMLQKQEQQQQQQHHQLQKQRQHQQPHNKTRQKSDFKRLG